MTQMPTTDFDSNPPMPVREYEHVVKSVNMGYEFIFELAHAFLRQLGRNDLELLVVGAGGGAEIERFLPPNRGWRLTGVDPSRDMLELARGKAERVGVSDRIDLVQGTVDDVTDSRRFDAATCLYVLHFLPDEAKLALLRGVRERINPGSPAFVVSACRVDVSTLGGVRDHLLGTWREYGVTRGIPPDRMRGIIDDLLAKQADATTEEGYRALMREAGFSDVVQVISVINDGICGWIAR